MTERFEIEFTEGGVDFFDTVMTGGAALIAEKVIDTVTGSDDHGWHCEITDNVTKVKARCWGNTKMEAQEKTFIELKKEIEIYFEAKEREKAEKEKEELLRLNKIRLQKQTEHSQQREQLKEPEDKDGNDFFTKAIIYILAAIAIIWFIFSVAIPLIVINLSILLLLYSLFKKRVNYTFLTLSFLGGVFMIIDYNNNWFSNALKNNVPFLTTWIPIFYIINLTAALVSVYLLISKIWFKDILHKQSSKNLISILSLLIFGGGVLLIQKHVDNPQPLFENTASGNSNEIGNENKISEAQQTAMVVPEKLSGTNITRVSETDLKEKAIEKPQPIISELSTYSGKVAEMKISVSFNVLKDSLVSGSYFFLANPNSIFSLNGVIDANGEVELAEFTGSREIGNWTLKKKAKGIYVGKMFNKNGPTLPIEIRINSK